MLIKDLKEPYKEMALVEQLEQKEIKKVALEEMEAIK